MSDRFSPPIAAVRAKRGAEHRQLLDSLEASSLLHPVSSVNNVLLSPSPRVLNQQLDSYVLSKKDFLLPFLHECFSLDIIESFYPNKLINTLSEFSGSNDVVSFDRSRGGDPNKDLVPVAPVEDVGPRGSQVPGTPARTSRAQVHQTDFIAGGELTPEPSFVEADLVEQASQPSLAKERTDKKLHVPYIRYNGEGGGKYEVFKVHGGFEPAPSFAIHGELEGIPVFLLAPDVSWAARR